MINPIQKAESFSSVMIALMIFSLLYLSYSQWQSKQNQRSNFLYQQKQALQIAENQISLQMANHACEKSILRNGLRFDIACSQQQIKVNFPLGEVIIR
ncbi:hypothetical protein BMT54_02115 [Pasteurellaceae bacterium 15-036681]|nr:hypothetical protein BMT54_02115 [Pasteurellaceae bacterium 15-036681]